MRKTILITSFMAVLLALTPAPGRAGCCGEVAAIGAAAGTIEAAIAAQTLAINGAIAQSGNAQKKAAVDATAKAADQAAQDQAALSNQQAQQRATELFQVPPDGCKSVANAGSLVRTREVAGQVAKQLSRETVDKKFQGGDPNNPKLDPSVSQQLVTLKHQEKYCTQEEAARGLCSRARAGYEGADLRSESLLKGAGPAGAGAPLSFTSDQLDAAKAYLGNVVTLTPPPLLTKVDDERTPQGRVYLGVRNARHAQISLAALPFNSAIADRTPQTQLAARARQIWSEMQDGVIDPVMPADYNPGAGEISPALFRQLEVDRRSGNPNWHMDVAAAMPDAVSKEQTYILALMASQQQQILQRLEELALIMAAQYAEQTKGQDAALQAKYQAANGSSNRH